uniref:Uncharacterized protein n=1 Tax=Phenylobacterium glaciei TaxID=2803784 RepID=A0A974P705_9CAUL|nr:hypothetical protein JKL49_11605 [Phenylobacterium glaciei]
MAPRPSWCSALCSSPRGLSGGHAPRQPFDGRYRLSTGLGQVPGRDFHSAFGVFFQLQMAAAYSLGQTVSQTLEIATLLFFGVVAGIMAYVARSRLSNLSALVVSFAILLLGCAPMPRPTTTWPARPSPCSTTARAGRC